MATNNKSNTASNNFRDTVTTPQSINKQILELLKRVEALERKFEPVNPYARAKQRMIEAIKKHRRFRSKRQWALYARISTDTFYRLEKEVIDELARKGYKVIYEPIFSRKNARIYSYFVRLEYS